MDTPNTRNRLVKLIGELVVSIEEKTAQVDQFIVYIQQLETELAETKIKLEVEQVKVLELASREV